MGDVEALVGQALERGDLEAAATAAIRGYGPEVLSYLVTLLRGEAAAGEVFSEFCEELWRALPAFRRAASLRTWAYRIAWCRAVDFIRGEARERARRPPAPAAISSVAAELRSSTAAYLRTSMKDRMRELRAQLAPDEQTLLILRLNRELSFRDVGAVMGLDEATVRKRFARLREKLRRLAAAAGIIPG
jgi:RNA polymerase sigma-70 factor (ECF subfamily)